MTVFLQFLHHDRKSLCRYVSNDVCTCCTEPSSYSSGYGQPASSHPGYQPPAHPVSQQYQTTASQPVSGSSKYPPATIASPSAFSSFPPMSAGYVYQQPGAKPPPLSAEQYAGYIRPQSLPRHHTPQSGKMETTYCRLFLLAQAFDTESEHSQTEVTFNSYLLL